MWGRKEGQGQEAVGWQFRSLLGSSRSSLLHWDAGLLSQGTGLGGWVGLQDPPCPDRDERALQRVAGVGGQPSGETAAGCGAGVASLPGLQGRKPSRVSGAPLRSSSQALLKRNEKMSCCLPGNQSLTQSRGCILCVWGPLGAHSVCHHNSACVSPNQSIKGVGHAIKVSLMPPSPSQASLCAHGGPCRVSQPQLLCSVLWGSPHSGPCTRVPWSAPHPQPTSPCQRPAQKSPMQNLERPPPPRGPPDQAEGSTPRGRAMWAVPADVGYRNSQFMPTSCLGKKSFFTAPIQRSLCLLFKCVEWE